MNGTDTIIELTRRGYGSLIAADAIRQAAASENGTFSLDRHRVSVDANGNWAITPLPWPEGAARLPSQAIWRSSHGATALIPPPHVHDDDGTAEGCPGCFTDPAGLADVLHVIEAVDAYLDDAGPQWAKDCPEANMQRRIGKAQLEAAEAMEELSLLTGENPRKGRHPEARERMLGELGDTACAALLGIQSVTKDTGATWTVFLEALEKAWSRVPPEARL